MRFDASAGSTERDEDSKARFGSSDLVGRSRGLVFGVLQLLEIGVMVVGGVFGFGFSGGLDGSNSEMNCF